VKTAEGYEIRFDGRPEPLPVGNIIRRHGPVPALREGFPDIWDACAEVRAEWKSARQDEDWTGKHLYNPNNFDYQQDKIPPLRVDFGGRIGCVLVKGNREPVGLTQK